MKNLIFEVSYEVLNKRSAVETFLKTKAHTMVGKYEGHYIMCGPIEDDKQHLVMNFTDQRTHDSVWGILVRKFEEQYHLPEGTIKYGYWNLIDTRVQCILLPLRALQSDSIKNLHASALEQLKDMTGLTQNDIKHEQGVINFGVMTWIFYSFLIHNCVNDGPRYRNIIVQLHDWTSCFGMSLFKRNPIEQVLYGHHDLNVNQIKFVYTVHNPALARAMGEDNVLINYFKKHDSYDKSEVDKLIKKYNVVYETLIEMNAVGSADKVTAISSVTAKESRILLNREPDVITWAGIGVDQQQGLYDWYEFHSTHKTNKQKIFAFLQTLFSGLNVDHTQVIFTAWRTNYNIEDIKLFIDSIALVKKMLEDEENLRKHPELQRRQMVALIIAPSHNHGIAEHVLQTMNLTQEIKIVTDSMAKTAQRCIVDQLCATENVNILETTIGELLGSKVTAALQRIQQAVNGNTVTEPLTTHKVPDQDPILSYLKEKGFSNHESQRVKILYIPEMLTKTSLFGLDYKDFIRGAHLGVFSSHYRPFGYGGPESVCVGTPCVVSDGVGFAALVQRAEEQLGAYDHVCGMSRNPWMCAPLGVRVVPISAGAQAAAAAQAQAIADYMRLDIETRIAMRNNMTRNSVFLDWSEQVEHFVRVYDSIAQ